jgi:ribonuclease BN (tRNA processing enzyme)
MPRKEPLNIYAPSGFQQIFDQLMNLYGSWIQSDNYEFFVKELPVETGYIFTIEEMDVQTCPTAHTDSSIAYRLKSSDGRIMVYTGDTDYCESVVNLSRDADLLLAECSFPNEFERKGHLTPAKAGRIAEEAHVTKLVLTHFYPDCDRVDVAAQCMEEYGGEIVIAEDNMVLTV